MEANPEALSQLRMFLQGSLFAALLAAASITDIHRGIIPDKLCIGIALTSLIAFEPLKLLGISASAIFLIAALLFGGMEGGDIKLMAAAGLVLGFNKSLIAAVIGLITLLAFHAGNAIIQKRCGRPAPKAYPLAPFLSLGCLTAYFFT